MSRLINIKNKIKLVKYFIYLVISKVKKLENDLRVKDEKLIKLKEEANNLNENFDQIKSEYESTKNIRVKITNFRTS